MCLDLKIAIGTIRVFLPYTTNSSFLFAIIIHLNTRIPVVAAKLNLGGIAETV